MKRSGNLWETLTSFGHLHQAFHQARKGSSRSPEAHAYFFHLEKALFSLQSELKEGAYMPSPYRYFRIYDPKERVISVAPFKDRVVHHAVVRLMEPIYERCFIFDSYATRKNKGTHAAIHRAQEFLRENRWFFKTDIDQYFASIRHDRLREILARKIKDPQFLALIEKIIRNGGENGVGLPIGNLTSQFLANVYLNSFDHFVKEELKVKAYLRYMDDFVLFSEDKNHLKAWRGEVEDYLRTTLAVELKPSASFFNQRLNGLRFLGARIFPDLVRIHPENLRRCIKRMKAAESALAKDEMTGEEWLLSLESRRAGDKDRGQNAHFGESRE
ncbi:MAG: reverse transcriptase/maturase family protein [Bacteroidia bacterium]|nr:reverse transcriptase/maturase family protein [Bacteroidia bacterium]